MSRSYKMRPFRKKTPAHRLDNETKTTLRNKMWRLVDFETQEHTDTMMMFTKYSFLSILVILLSTSCVGKRMFIQEQDKSKLCAVNLDECEQRYTVLLAQNKDLSNEIIQLENQLANERNRVALLEQQLEYFKSTNTNLLDRLSDLAVVSKIGADNIRKSLEAINDQNKYIKDLTQAMRQKDSLNLVLVMNLKRSLADINDEDVTIEVKKGVVYISISDKLLFKSGSYEISPRAEEVLGKIAKVLKDQKQLDILVEGHTDNVPILTACMADNWDLSVKRATTVVRYLQTKHNISLERMTAGGRSEYVPKAVNTTTEGKAANRRTEIIVLPKLDQFFELLEPPAN